MKVKIEYKGSSLHERRLSKKDLEKAEVEFQEGEDINLVWKAGPLRKSAVLESGEDLSEDTIEAIVEILSNDPAFKISKDGEIVSDADPKAGETDATGANKVSGAGGSEVLASAIGASGRVGTTGGSTAGATGGVGGSTPGATP